MTKQIDITRIGIKKLVTAKKEAGYFTVEAALIMPLVIAILVPMIFLSFYSYDRCVLEQCAYAAALRGSSNRFSSAEEAKKESLEAAESLITEKLFAVKEISTTVHVSALSVSVTYKCKVNMPLGTWLKELVGEDFLSLEVEKQVLRNKTVAIIRQL